MKKTIAVIVVVLLVLAYWRKETYKADAERAKAAAVEARAKVLAKMPNSNADETDSEDDSE